MDLSNITTRISGTRVLAMTGVVLVILLGAFILTAPGGFLIEEELGSGAD